MIISMITKPLGLSSDFTVTLEIEEGHNVPVNVLYVAALLYSHGLYFDHLTPQRFEVSCDWPQAGQAYVVWDDSHNPFIHLGNRTFGLIEYPHHEGNVQTSLTVKLEELNATD